MKAASILLSLGALVASALANEFEPVDFSTCGFYGARSGSRSLVANTSYYRCYGGIA